MKSNLLKKLKNEKVLTEKMILEDGDDSSSNDKFFIKNFPPNEEKNN